MNKTRKVTHISCPCIICGGTGFYHIHSGHDRLYHTPGNFEIMQCSNCGLFVLNPKLPPEEAERYYPENYLCFLPAIEDETNRAIYLDRLRSLKKRMRKVKKFIHRPGRILDVGCATGILLNGFNQEGWKCFGVEPDRRSCDYAKQRFGLDLFNGHFEDSNFPDDFFDVVTMMDVLEHFYDPKTIIIEVLRILKPGGGFLGIMPNASSLEKLIFGQYWDGWEMPRHNQIFTPRTLKNFLLSNGFHTVTIFSFTGRHGNFMMSIRFWLDASDWSPRLKRIIYNFFNSIVMRTLMLPLFLILEKMNRSTNFAFFAIKDNSQNK